MKVSMFTSWQVRCGIASYAAELVAALRALDETEVSIVAFDRQAHPRPDYVRWGEMMNAGDVAHIQHEYTFFGYLLPWRNQYPAFVAPIHKPVVITRHVSFDGPLGLPGRGLQQQIRQLKWALYNRWLGPYARYLNLGTFDLAQRIIVLSKRVKAHLVARGMHPEKIEVIPAGVPSVPVAAGGERLRVRWGWEDGCVLGVFGFITPAKGHMIALEALAHLPERYALLIAGGLRRDADRAALAAIERDIRSQGRSDRVRVTGYLEEAEIPSHIGACDALIYPATHVDSSYSVVTGLAYQAAPVIASDVYGHQELADAGAGIALFRSGDASDLARTVQDVLRNPDRRVEMRRAAARYARENSWRAIAERTREVYAGLSP
jgi:glycosyltransferase involved in cell wall biosynthesis